MNENYQKARLQEIVARTRLELEGRGVLRDKSGRDYSTLREKWRAAGLEVLEHCAGCGKKLPAHLREFCSGQCVRQERATIPQ